MSIAARLAISPMKPVVRGSASSYQWNEQFDTCDLDDVASDYSKDEDEDDSFRLPAEVLAIVAEYLVLDSAHKTCANLNRTCRAVQRETTAILWTTVTGWNPPRFAYSDSAEDELMVEEMFERWEEMLAAPGAKYTQFLLVPPFALDREHKQMWLSDEYPFSQDAQLVFPKLKALVYFEEYRSGPRLVLSQPHLHICSGYEPCTFDIEGLLRLLAMAPQVRGGTMIRHPWTIRVPESTTSNLLHTNKAVRGVTQALSELDVAGTHDKDDDDEISEGDDQYQPLAITDLSTRARARLEDCFQYPLTIVEYSSTFEDRQENRVSSTFIEIMRLAKSLPSSRIAMRLSIRGLLMDEVLMCIETYQPLLMMHAEYSALKLEFQVRDIPLDGQPPFEQCVERLFEDIRAVLFAISCRGTPLEKMGTFDISRDVDGKIEETWYMRVLPEERLIGWGRSPKIPFDFLQDFPGEDDDAYQRLRDEYALGL